MVWEKEALHCDAPNMLAFGYFLKVGWTIFFCQSPVNFVNNVVLGMLA